MRKLITSGIATVISLTVIAQGGSDTIPNASFEQYSTVSIPVPANWEHSSESFKILYLDQYSYGIKQEQPGFSGNYALRIEVPNVLVDTFVAMQVATLPTMYVPIGLELWTFSLRYKYYPNNVSDTASIIVAGLDDTLGLSAVGIIRIAGATSTFALASTTLFVGLGAIDSNLAQNIKYWVLLISPVNPGCTLVVDSINVYNQLGNYYSTFPLNGDFEDWYIVSVDTFKHWIVDAAFQHDTTVIPGIGVMISRISGTLKAGTMGAPYGNTYAILTPANRVFLSDTPYNALFQQYVVPNNSPFDFEFAYNYTSNIPSDSATFLFIASDADSPKVAFSTLLSLPQTGGNWVTVSVPFDSLCQGCSIDTVLIAFLPQRVTIDNNGQLIGLPVDTGARLAVDMKVMCYDTLPQAQFTYITNNLTVTVFDSSLYADSIVWDFGDSTVIPGGDSVSHTYNADGTYTLCQYAFNACRQADTICVVVSVTTVSAAKPSTAEDLKLVSRGNEYRIIAKAGIKQIEVINSSGQLVNSKVPSVSTRTYNLDLSKLGKGVYLIRVTTIKGTNLVRITIK